jgi:diguanylate cyclase (GGDEF)-like protein
MFITPPQEQGSNEGRHAPHRHLFTPHLEGEAPLMPENPQAQTVAVRAGEELQKPVQAVEIRGTYDYPVYFIQDLNHAILRAKQAGTQGAFFIVSVNNLAMIMNAYGHDGAEKVMHQLCDVLRGEVEKGDLIERVGRDQIGVIIHACDKPGMATYAKQFHRLIQDYGTTSAVGALHVTCSIGSVDFPNSSEEATDALDKAYIALNSTYGISYRTFEETRDEGVLCRQQMGLANYLRRAIQENRLRLAYQPVVESSTGHISHYEALLRIIDEEGKISSAGALIPVAERMGLIDMIDHIVFDMVMKELMASPGVALALNVSNITTDNPHWLEHATSTLKKHPDIASRTIIEITETAAQRDLRRTAYFVASLQAQGCQVALDDFGSGYTSFRQLKALSVDMVKIDGAFVKDLVDNADNRFFVKTLLDFTRGFGLAAVAEYVEKGETAKLLMELGVQYMQGYYFGKPENYRSWLNKGEYRRG